MTVPLVGVGGYFVREGDIIGEYNRVAALYGSALDAGFQSIWVNYASSDQAAVAGLPEAVSTYRNSGQTYQRVLVTAGQQSSILQVSDDVTVVPATMQQSIRVLVGQMVAASQTIQRATLSAVVTPWGSNLGDATVVIGTNNGFGDPLDMIFAETIKATCTAAGTSYAETLQFIGAPTVPSVNPYWPGGSGTNTTLTITDPTQATLVTDGGFENWTGTGNNTPVNWDIINGAAGVTVFRGSGGVRGSYTAVLTSDGSSATQLGQTVSLTINTVYAITVQAKVSTSDGAGVFRMAITDDNGTVLTDDAGNSLSATFAMTGAITTSFQCFTAFFSTPRQLPVTTRVQYGFSVAPTAAKTCTMDLAALIAPVQLYGAGSEWAAAFSGANRTAVGDYYSIAVSNDLTGQSFARGMDRLFNMRQMNVYFPSANSPTISDSLVTH